MLGVCLTVRHHDAEFVRASYNPSICQSIEVSVGFCRGITASENKNAVWQGARNFSRKYGRVLPLNVLKKDHDNKAEGMGAVTATIIGIRMVASLNRCSISRKAGVVPTILVSLRGSVILHAKGGNS